MRQLLALGLLFVTACLMPALAENRKKSPPVQGSLAKPVLLEVNNQPLVREGSTPLFPFVGDFYGEGRQDLLLGAPGGGEKDVMGNEDGRLQVFRNVGDHAKARLAAPRWFDEIVPTGLIPKG